MVPSTFSFKRFVLEGVEVIKRIINWNYERASWQWDVLCILCLCFIFLTPNHWFVRRENLATKPSRVIVKADGFSTERTALLNKVRELSGNPSAEIIELREKRDIQGEIFYEIDIR